MKKNLYASHSSRSGHQDLTSDHFKLFTFGQWHRLWLSLALFAVVTATFIDSVLLQRKFSIFTGGFLSPNYLKNYIDIGFFLILSLIADIGLIAPLVALLLWLCTKIRINAKAAALIAITVGIIPIITADYVNYQIGIYLGDAFKPALAFEIGCRNILEIFLYVIPHIKIPLFILLGTSLIILLIFWILKLYLARFNPLPHSPSLPGLIFHNMIIVSAVLIIICFAYINDGIIHIGLDRKPSIQFFNTIGEFITDVDRDGFGIVQMPRDPAPFNAKVFPYAVEIPGNGIDENGLAGDLPSDIVLKNNTPNMLPKWNYRPNVILIVLESIRADLIDARFEGKEITPVLNRIAREGLSAPLAFSHNGFTATSRYHIFSGAFIDMPGQHTLIDDFKANGYEVAYFSAQDVPRPGEDFDIGFFRADVAFDALMEPEKRYTLSSMPGSIALPCEVMVEKVLEFLKGRQSQKPLFIHVNIQDTHFPYYHKYIHPLISTIALQRHQIGPGRADDLWATYVNTAANVDHAIGEILSGIKHYLGDPTPGIIVISDHGESLYDDGSLGHGFILSDIQMRVPLIVANLPMVIKQPFGHADLRNALRHALENKPYEYPLPVLKENGPPVFQYIGSINRPRQISFRYTSQCIIYDFYTRRVQMDGVWRDPDGLVEPELQAFRSLVYFWEKEHVLAQKNLNLNISSE